MIAVLVPAWRNWQTRQTQNLVTARSWGFDPLRRHHLISCCYCGRENDDRAFHCRECGIPLNEPVVDLSVLNAISPQARRILRTVAALTIGGWCLVTIRLNEWALLLSTPFLLPITIWLTRRRDHMNLGRFARTITNVALLFALVCFGLVFCAIVVATASEVSADL